MKQLSGLDAGFLYMETPTTFGHVNSLSVYRRPRSKDFDPYQLFRSHLEARLPDLEPFRRRLVEVPFQLDHPWWIDDPDFDLDFHVRHIAVPPPGGDEELAALVARSIGRPLDRSRPLWEAYVIEGLTGNRWALLLKLHHATIDGASGAELLTMLLDTKPSKKLPTAEAAPSKGEPVPTPIEMLNRTALNYAIRPERLFRAQMRAMRDASAIAGQHRNDLLSAGVKAWSRLSSSVAGRGNRTDEQSAPSGGAPPTPFNKSITPNRRYAFRTASLGEIKTIKNATGATVNDVVMTVCAGAMRKYLQRHDSPVDRPLVTMVPVSIRTGEEEDRWTNRVSSIFAALPVHLDDPIERLGFTHEAMIQAKSNFDLVPADALQDFARFSPPAVFSQAAALATRMRIADRVASPVNLVISNVPGPREPLYLGPARLEHYYPVSTVAEGMGLNITVQSYEDKLDYGLVACRELVPDLWDLMDLIMEEQGELLALAKAAMAEQAGSDEGSPSANGAAPSGSAKQQKAGKTSS
ncbi:MAG: wax ester/triacylglycerol synthase family O-acyltransferase [Actinomycetota bacterium]